MAFIVTGRKFFNQLVNGNDFSLNTSSFDTYFQYNAAELCKLNATVRFSWDSKALISTLWDVSGAVGANVITRANGSFTDEGFIAGDTLDYFKTGVVTASDRVITFVDDLNMVIDGASIANESLADDLKVRGKTALRGFRFRFGIIDNNAGDSFNSLVDGTLQQWSTEDVGVGAIGARSTSFVSGVYASTFPTSKTGNFEIKFVQDIDDYTQEFEFNHIFRNIYYYTEAEKSPFLFHIPPVNLTGQETFKYIFECKGGVTSLNPNEIKTVLDNSTLGNSGWFNENFNGELAEFAITSTTYKDNATSFSISSVDIDNDTDVEIIIESPTGLDLDANHNVVVSISWLPAETEYTQNSNDYDTNFLFDSLFSTRGAGTVSSSIITDLLVTAGPTPGTELQINFTTSYTAAQAAIIGSGEFYFISVAVDDINDPNIHRTTALAPVNTFLKDTDIEGLFGTEDFSYYRHDMDTLITGLSSYAGYVEDGVLFKANLFLETAVSDPTFKSLRMRLVAFNTVTNDFFEIYSQNFGLGAVPVNGTVQQINTSSDTSFNLIITSPRRFTTINNNGTSGTKLLYEISYPFKLGWMDYRGLAGVDGVFYDNALLNNGQYQKIDRYSGSNDYEIRVMIDADILDSVSGITTRYREVYPFVQVQDYDDDDGLNQFSSEGIEILTESGLAIPNGKILNGVNTRIAATFVPTIPVLPADVYFGVIRMEVFQSGGYTSVFELSSIEGSATPNTLKPLSGETLTKVTNSGTDILVECLIDWQEIKLFPAGTEFHISTRIGLTGGGLDAKFMESGIVKLMEDGTTKILE